MRIYLFKGLMGEIFSRGMYSLADKLKDAGHTVSVHPWYSRRSVEKLIITQSEPVGLVGHSLGANTAVNTALSLSRSSIDVLGLAVIDATVEKTIDFTDGYAFRSRDIRDKDINGLEIIHRDDLTHTQIDKDETVHNLIIDLFNR